MTFLREHVHLCKVLTHRRDEVINAWLNKAYGLYHVHLCKRTGTAFVIPVLLQQPIAFTVSGMLLAILAPILGMLVLPALLAVALVGPVIGIRAHFVTLPLRFSGPLAGLVRTKPLGLGPGIRHKATPAMDTAHRTVHGFLLREAVSQNVALPGRIRTTTKADAEGYIRLEMGEAEKNNDVVNFWSDAPGLRSHR